MNKPTWQKQIINGVPCIVPFDPISKDNFAGYKDNQILTGKLAGTRKPRSIKQLRFYWVGCGIVSDNNRMNFTHRNQVDYYIRNRLMFFDLDKTVVMPPKPGEMHGKTIFYPRSIALHNLGHIESCEYFTRAFEVMAEILECTIEEFMDAVGRE